MGEEYLAQLSDIQIQSKALLTGLADSCHGVMPQLAKCYSPVVSYNAIIAGKWNLLDTLCIYSELF